MATNKKPWRNSRGGAAGRGFDADWRSTLHSFRSRARHHTVTKKWRPVNYYWQGKAVNTGNDCCWGVALALGHHAACYFYFLRLNNTSMINTTW